ncbi:MAG: nitroreductase [Alphaproteobacteria bacterium HGW-Alphaproteobacteria-11]|nr:MAG: nitroreductase [Alphaproteobacteria bacterium HGW-Alphaproteobacteria-11]
MMRLKAEAGKMQEAMPFHEVVRRRKSARSFLADPVPDALLRSVAEDARHAPSNSNVQPWVVHIASGEARDRLSKAMLEAAAEERMTPDFPFSYDDLYGVYRERQQAQGAAYFNAAGIPRDAAEQRRYAMLRNLEFFGAPHVCLLFMTPVYEPVRVAGDVGMYGQTFLLSLAAHGLAGVPQTLLSLFANTVREVLGIDPSLRMLFGISFGYPEPDNPVNSFPLGKAPVAETVTFHR